MPSPVEVLGAAAGDVIGCFLLGGVTSPCSSKLSRLVFVLNRTMLELGSSGTSPTCFFFFFPDLAWEVRSGWVSKWGQKRWKSIRTDKDSTPFKEDGNFPFV